MSAMMQELTSVPHHHLIIITSSNHWCMARSQDQDLEGQNATARAVATPLILTNVMMAPLGVTIILLLAISVMTVTYRR